MSVYPGVELRLLRYVAALAHELNFTQYMRANEFEADMDVYNVANSNAVFNVRTLTGRVNITDFTTNQTAQIPQFNSPIGVLGPRIVRFGLTYKFGR